MKKVILLALTVTLTGCSSTNISKVIQELGKDDSVVVHKLGTVYGTSYFVRVGPRTNSVVISPDGTVSIGK